MTTTRTHGPTACGFLRYTLHFFIFIFVTVNTMAVAAAIDSRPVRVGVYDNKPIVFAVDPGNYAGLALDVLGAVADQEGWTLKYVYAPWSELLMMAKAGDIDLLVGIAYSEERGTEYDFTQQTLINNWGTVYRSPSSKISSLADLQGKRIALASGTIHSEAFIAIMSHFAFPFTALGVEHYRDGMQAVQEGAADAVVVNRVISLLHAGDYGLLETGIIFNPVEVRYAAAKGKSREILAAIDQHLTLQKKDKSSAYYQSLDFWINDATRNGIPYWLTIAVVIATLVGAVLLISNFLIRQQVAARTAELSESELRFRQLAENIKEVFWVGAVDWQEIYYVSPAFETIWGASRKTLYANPMMWFDQIHADDKEMIIEDLHKKIRGDLDIAAFPEFRIETAEGIRWILARAYPIRGPNGSVIRIAGIAEDITERKRAYETIDFMAHHDSLTHLTNRYAFEKKLGELIETTDWQQTAHALMYIDLDQFKIINDTCGHAAGDKMLIELTQLLLISVGESGIIARLGGDEFGLILQDVTLKEAKELAGELLDTIRLFRFVWNARSFSVGASIGLIMMNTGDLTRSDLLSAADMACYAAKERGRNRLHIYSNDDSDLVQRQGEMQWVNRLETALEENRFVLYKQTIQALQANQEDLPHCEFLLRMLDEEGKLVMPGAFIPAAERYELMPKLDRWVISHVLAFMKEESDAKGNEAPQNVAFVNLSGQIFNDDGFADFILAESRHYGIDPRAICLEITETAAIARLDMAVEFIKCLRLQGFRFALDDFGSGMSSFAYLKYLPVDYLKIDGVFVKEMMNDPMNAAIVEAITKIGHTAKLKVIAEWVEDPRSLGALAAIGVDFAQGYAIDKPRALPACRPILASEKI